MKRIDRMKQQLLVLGTALISLNAEAMDLKSYLQQIAAKNPSLKAYEASASAADGRFATANLDLSPVLTLSGKKVDDQSTQLMAPTLTRVKTTEYSIGLAKKFSTGTSVMVQGLVTEYNIDQTAAPNHFENAQGSVALSLSQSLWKNSFGHGTRTKLEKEAAQSALERNSFDLQGKQALIEAEGAFWNHIYLGEEFKQRKAALERAEKIEGWVSRRVKNGIGDRSDLLGAKGLTAARRLEMMGSADELLASEVRIRELMDLGPDEKVPELSANLDQIRSMNEYVPNQGKGSIVRLDTYLAVLEAKAKALGAEETIDSLRPDLTLEGMYKTNGYDPELSGAMKNMTDTDKPTSMVGVKFTWLLDWSVKNSARDTAKMDALAAKLKKDQKLRESADAWIEIQRRYQVLSKKIKAAREMSDLQTGKASSERDKLSKGRSITSQVILAEQDASEAELMLTRLLAEQRKLEAQGRLFVRIEENL